jgi:hypothetical protein
VHIPKSGKECCAAFPVSFHAISPQDMRKFHLEIGACCHNCRSPGVSVTQCIQTHTYRGHKNE